MKKHKKWLYPLIAVLSFIILLLLIKNPILGAYISSKIKTAGSYSSISVGSKIIEIDNFRVKNLSGFKNKYALVTKKVQVKYSLTNLFKDPANIDSIDMRDLDLTIECKNPLCTKNNWTEIINNISKNEEKISNKVIIDQLNVTNLNVTISGMGLDSTKKKIINIPYIQFKNISSKKGFPTQQLISIIFRSANLQDYLKGILENNSIIEDFFKPFSDNQNEKGFRVL